MELAGELFSVTRLKRALLANWRLVVGTTIGTAAASLITAAILPPVYQATATILPRQDQSALGLLAASGAVPGGLPLGGLLGKAMGAVDLVDILSSRAMASRVISALRLRSKLSGWRDQEQLEDKLVKMVKIEPPSLGRQVIVIRADAPSPSLAAAIANG